MIRAIAAWIAFTDIEQRPAAGKALFDAVPVAYACFANSPTEENDLGSEQTRKIDQPLFDSFAHATVAMDFFDPALHLSDEQGNLPVLTQAVHEVWSFRIELFLANNYFAFAFQPMNILKNLFDQRAQRGKQSVGFIDRKEARKGG